MLPFRRSLRCALTGGGGGTAFSPTDIAGLQLWLDASQIAGLNDGDAVATWADVSGNGRDVTQASATARPTYQTAEVNGLPVVRCDGVDDFLATASSIVAAQPVTVFLVLRENGGGIGQYYFDGGSAGTDRCSMAGSYSGTPDELALFAGSVVAGTTQTHPMPLVLLRAVFNGASSAIFRNSTSYLTGNAGAQALSVGITVGARFNGVSPLNGDICDLLVYDSVLSVGNAALVENYLRSKWGTP